MSTLQQLVLAYVNERRRSGELAVESARSIKYTLLGFCEFVGPVRPAKLRPEHVRRWLVETSFAPEAARSSLSRVRVWCQWMVRRGEMRVNPVADIKGPKRPVTVPRGLLLTAVQSIFAVCPDDRAELVILLMAQEGLRCCEIAGLERGRVNLAELVVLVKGKGRNERVLPLSLETHEALVRYLAGSSIGAGPLIRSLTHANRGISAKRISEMVNGWMREAGVEGTAHALRHTAATDALKNGAHLLNVKAMLGHTSLSTTEKYLPWVLGDLRKAMGGRTYGQPKRQQKVAAG